jgi:hypothetical protein
MTWNELIEKLEKNGYTPKQVDDIILGYRLIRTTLNEVEEWLKEDGKKEDNHEAI